MRIISARNAEREQIAQYHWRQRRRSTTIFQIDIQPRPSSINSIICFDKKKDIPHEQP
jgi:hypothetical protein